MLKLSQLSSLVVAAICAIASPILPATKAMAASAPSIVSLDISNQYIAMNNSIVDTSWRLSFWTKSDTLVDLVPNSEVTLEFDQDRVSGSSGCNRLTASYQVNNYSLEISPAAGTRMACEEAVMNQEFQFLQALEGVQEFRINGGNLIITYTTEEGSGVMVFENHHTAMNNSIVDTAWKLLFWTESNSMIDVAADSEVSLNFTGDRLSGTGGCNRLVGSYKINDNKLEMSPLASTSMACEPELMTQESHFMQALQGIQEFRINGENLVITYTTEEGSGMMVFKNDSNIL